MKLPKLRKNGDGRAFAVYPGTGGRRAYFGTFGTDQAETAYRKWLKEVLDCIESKEPFPVDRRPGQTITDLAAIYLPWAENYYRDSREFANVTDTIRLLAEHSGDVYSDEFGPNALRAFQGHLVASKRFARTTINSHVNRVRRFMKWCQSRELVPRGTTEDLATVAGLRRGKTSARESVPVAPVPDVVWRATLPFLSETVRTMVMVQYLCGMRPGEVCDMTPAQIDRAGEVWFYRPERHKNAHRGHGLTKAIPPVAQSFLLPRMVRGADDRLFVTEPGNPWNADTYGHAVRRGARRAILAGVPIGKVWHPNQLRHAILTKIRDELGEEEAQHWAGHSRPDTTALYTKKVEGILKRVAAALVSRDVG